MNITFSATFVETDAQTANRHLYTARDFYRYLQFTQPAFRPPTANSLISIGAGSRALVVFGAVDVRTVVERAVSAPNRTAAALVEEMPVKAGKGAVLRALVLHKERALLRAELLQVTGVQRSTLTLRSWTGIVSRGSG